MDFSKLHLHILGAKCLYDIHRYCYFFYIIIIVVYVGCITALFNIKF